MLVWYIEARLNFAGWLKKRDGGEGVPRDVYVLLLCQCKPRKESSLFILSYAVVVLV